MAICRYILSIMKPSVYQKDFDYSYTYGVYPTLELIKYRPNNLVRIFFDPKGDSNMGLSQIKQHCFQNNIPIAPDSKFVQKVAESENAYCVAQFKKYSPKLNPQSNHLVLVGPRDVGNLGTIIRTMVGFDFADLAVIRPAVDIFSPKTIRASMGELFQINFEYFDSFADYQTQFLRHYYPLITSASEKLESTIFKPPSSLIFGNESAGLPNEYNQIGTNICISQNRQIDSLNLASAVSIALHHFYCSFLKS